MPVRNFEVTFDATNSKTLAAFWMEALGYEPMGPPTGYDSWEEWRIKMELSVEEMDEGASIAAPDGSRYITFLNVPEPKTAKNRMHLDLDVLPDRRAPVLEQKAIMDAEVERLEKLGATKLYDTLVGDHYRVTMADPEGNEFCLR
ncbi:MAG TPA: VOC family protein [Actinomycetota bacterium]|nr:VOC family protein [Actinomycetota bacterium]